MTKMMIRTALLLLLIVLTHSADFRCSPFAQYQFDPPPLSNIQSGNRQITKNGFHNITFNIIPSPVITNSQIAVALHDIHGFEPHTGVHFHLQRTYSSDSLFELKFQLEDEANWVSIDVDYIISGRNDLIVDMIFRNYVGLGSNSYASVTFGIPLLYEQQWMVTPFLVGLETQGNVFQFQFVNQNVNLQTLQSFSIFVKTQLQNNNQIEYISLSYILFHNRDVAEVLSQITYPGFALPPNTHAFKGASSLQSKNYHYGRLLDHSSSLQNFNDMFGLHGVIIEADVSMNGDSPGGRAPSNPLRPGVYFCVSRKECLQSNGNLVYKQVQIYTITLKCVVCPDFSTFNQQSQQCICNSGYFKLNNRCIQNAPANFVSSQISVNYGSSAQTSNIVCLPGYVAINGRCQRCGRNQIFSNGRCVPITTQRTKNSYGGTINLRRNF